MDPITQQTVLAAAGAGGDKVYVDDVFSTTLYNGTGTTRNLNTGIDNSDKSLIWFKVRNDTNSHVLVDTERGADKQIFSNNSGNTVTRSDVTAFTTTGATLGNVSGWVNSGSGSPYVAWNFKAAPGFFDVVTWTGNSTAGRQIPHSLGSVPGMVIVKRLTASENWYVYHRSLGATKYLKLSTTDSVFTGTNIWNDTAPTSTHFTVGTDSAVNINGSTYVAYVFAHDDASFGTDGDESIIKCGTYTGNAGTNPINLGFEAQWILIKQSGNTGDWSIIDVTREASMYETRYVFANESNSESSTNSPTILAPSPTGFTLYRNDSATNRSGRTYIYMAIRRPHKPLDAFDPPLDATDVFAMDTGNGSSSIPTYDSGFPVDFAIHSQPNHVASRYAAARLLGSKFLSTDADNSESNNSHFVWDSNLGWGKAYTSIYSAWMFKRAPGFFDVVTWTGNHLNRTITHNLASTPEFIIVKRRSSTEDWTCYHSSLGNTKYIQLNGSSAAGTLNSAWNATDPTSTNFTLGNHDRVNTSGQTYVAYLFATLPGISKVGTFTGTGDQTNGQNIDCGFTNGARFILIKRTDGTGHWTLYDSARGIISGGNSPYLKLDTTEAQATGNNHLGTYAQGFNIREYNFSGQTYIFLAIA